MTKPLKKGSESNPENLVFDACYAAVDVSELMVSASGRSRIRRLPVSQLYFGIQALSESDLVRLLPHVTEEQWQGMVDLDIWQRDSADMTRFLSLQMHIITSEDPVARKLFRAVDLDLWRLLFRSSAEVVHLSEDVEHADSREWLDTSDGLYRIFLPADPEKAKVLRALITRLYGLKAEETAVLLEEVQWMTTIELQEACYQQRKSRTESEGFQDYFEALGVYSPFKDLRGLPRKRREGLKEVTTVPMRLPGQTDSSLLLLRALGQVDDSQEAQELLEELFYVCNKLISADQVPVAEPDLLKSGIRKALAGINLGLDIWAGSSPGLAVDGVRNHYLETFFQIGYYHLLTLQSLAKAIPDNPSGGSYEEAAVDGFLEPYPVRVVLLGCEIKKRFFWTREDLDEARLVLEQVTGA
jgi:hypothetical protein